MEEREKLLGEEKIIKVLMKLSIPATIAMLVNAIYNIVDTIFIGRGVGTLGIAGVAIFLPIQMTILALGLLFGIGGGSAFARAFGKKDKVKVNYITGNVFSGIGIIAVTISVLGYIFAEPLLKIFGASSTVMSYAVDYAKSMFIGSLVFPMCVAINNIIRAEGAAMHSMITMIIGMIINIFLDYIFIYIFHWGIWGAGIATSISKFISFGYIIYYFLAVSSVKLAFKYFKLKWDILKDIFAVGSSAFAVQISTSIVAVVMNHTLNYYGGDLAVSIYGIVYKVNLFFLMPMNGLVQGMQPIVGYNKGAGNNERIREAVIITAKLTVLISLIALSLIMAIPEQIMALFTENTELINQGKNILRIVVLMSPVVGIYLTGVGLFQSLGKGKMSLGISILRQPLLFGIFLGILPRIGGAGIAGVWLSFPISDLAAVIITIYMCKRQFKVNLNNKSTY